MNEHRAGALKTLAQFSAMMTILLAVLLGAQHFFGVLGPHWPTYVIGVFAGAVSYAVWRP